MNQNSSVDGKSSTEQNYLGIGCTYGASSTDGKTHCPVTLLIYRQTLIHLLRPGVDAAFQVLDLLESGGYQ